MKHDIQKDCDKNCIVDCSGLIANSSGMFEINGLKGSRKKSVSYILFVIERLILIKLNLQVFKNIFFS